MTQLVCWVLFPLVLAALSLGCGWLLEWGMGSPLPEALVMPVGLAVIVVVAEVITKLSATAPLATWAVVGLAVLGFIARRPWGKRPGVAGWPVAAAVLVYLAYLAPVFMSGEPTFTGYIKLDDTATWMAMTDRVLGFAHSLSHLAPSTYLRTLGAYLTGGEPVGALLPWGIGHQLVGQDLAWVFQPYLAFLGAMLGLSLWSVAGTAIRSRPWRALAVFIAAQSALIYGYSLWGGVKEVAAAWLLALTIASVAPALEARGRVRSLLPLAAASFAMLGVLGYGGAVWLAVPLVVVAVVSILTWFRRRPRSQVAGLVALAALLALGLIRGAQVFLNTNTALTGGQLGNLLHPLNPLQVFGVWPVGDFRVRPPDVAPLAYALIAVVIVGALIGVLASDRTRWSLPALYVATAAVGTVLVSIAGSPWVQGKAFAIVSPAAPLLAVAGAAALLGRAVWRRAGAIAGAIAISFGVLWSNVLAYHHVTLAPYGQLRELSEIGHRFAGQGPTLINEYQPYAARHFLRTMDAESPSELRFRVVPLIGGGQVAKGGYADLDQFELAGLLVYRSIVIRRSPVASRPPAPYRLVWDGHWYQLWQRPQRLRRPVLAQLPLGNPLDPAAVPECQSVLRLAGEAGRDGLLAAAVGPTAVVTAIPSPPPEGNTTRLFGIAKPGSYEVWIGGSFVRRITAYVDGVRTGSSHEVLNEAGQWTPLGTIPLRPGVHRVTLNYGDAQLYPGSGGPGAAGPGLAVGPLALATGDPSRPVVYAAPARAHSLCGRRWDWVEALGP